MHPNHSQSSESNLSSNLRRSACNRNSLEAVIANAFSQASKAIADALAENNCPECPPTTSHTAHVSEVLRSPSTAVVQILPCTINDSEDEFQKDFPLPSLTGRRFNPMKSVGSRRASNKRTSKSFLRTITCLPLSEICERRGPGMKQIVIPRGKQREKLHNMGLIAKINILNKWTKVQLHDEIESLFRRCFIVDVGSKFSYEHLQIFPGSKVLTRPKASRNFNWDAQAVLSLHKSNLYILTAAPLKLLPNDDFAANIAGNENVALQDKCSETYQQRCGVNMDSTHDEVLNCEVLFDTQESSSGSNLRATSYDNYVEIVGSEPFSSEDDCDEDFQNSLMASIVSADEDLTIRFTAGLNEVGLLERMRDSPTNFEEQFIFKMVALSATCVMNELFIPQLQDLAEEGSNKRSQQNKAMLFWRDFVLDVEDRKPRPIETIGWFKKSYAV